MKKKILLIIILSILILPIVGCKKEEDKRTDAEKFKEEYEALNQKEREEGKLYRTISIDEKNPIIYTTYEELATKIKDNENFIVYFGKSTSEYCRSVIPYLLEQAKTQGIDKIYYVDITTKEEETEEEGTKALAIGDEFYLQVLDKLGESNIDESTLAVFINGKMEGKTSGISSKQKDSSGELTGEMKQEMLNKFRQIFITYNSNRE